MVSVRFCKNFTGPPFYGGWTKNFKNLADISKYCIFEFTAIFLNMINLCPNIWFIKNSKCQQFFHLKKEPPKKQFFIFLRGCYFVIGSPIDMNVDGLWETSAGFLKSVALQLFLKYSQSNVNVNVKRRSKFNCL